MPELRQRHSVANIALTTGANPATTTAPSMNPQTSGWNVGDVLQTSLNLRLSGTYNLVLGGGTLAVKALQALQFLKSLTFGTDLHQNIIDQVDGVSLFRMLCAEEQANGYTNDVPASATTNTAFEANLRVPFAKSRDARFWDAAVDLLRAQPYLRANWGTATDVGTITGGTGTTSSIGPFNIEILQEFYQGPFIDGKGQSAFPTVAPIFMPYFATIPVTSGFATQQQINLPYGDRIYRRIFIFQRNSSTGAELNNTVTGVNDQDRFSLVLNGSRIYDNVEVLQIQKQNVAEYGAASLGSGTVVLDFSRQLSNGKIWGARISDMLNLVTPNQNVFQLLIDTTSITNGELILGLDCLKPLPQGSARVVASAPPAAK